MDLLTDEKKSSHFGPSKKSEDPSNIANNFKNSKIAEDQSMSCEQSLSNIEETIKFMEEKLFNPNWKKSKGGEKEIINESLSKIQEPEKRDGKLVNNFLGEVF